jgi:hypothetical protein
VARALLVVVVPTAHADGVVFLALEGEKREKERKERKRESKIKNQVSSGDNWSELAGEKRSWKEKRER